MSDYLTNLAARTLNRAPSVQPRHALLFEPPQPDASEPSSQLSPPATAHGDATFSPVTPSDANPRESAAQSFPPRATPRSAAHDADSPLTGSHGLEPPSAGRLIEPSPSLTIPITPTIPTPTSPSVSTPGALETDMPRTSVTPASESYASDETRRRSNAPSSADETRAAFGSELSTATPSPDSRLTTAMHGDVTGTMHPAKRRTTGASAAGAIDADASAASVQPVARSVDVAAQHSSGQSDALRPSPPGLLAPSLPVTSARDDAPALSTRVARDDAESVATGGAMRLRPRVELPARADDDGASKREAAPTIHVSIGRIEVRAVAPPAPQPAPARPAPAMSLDEYLRAHNGGRR